jgi:hypothetical protein
MTLEGVMHTVSFVADAYRVYESEGVVRVAIERSSGEGTVCIGYDGIKRVAGRKR